MWLKFSPLLPWTNGSQKNWGWTMTVSEASIHLGSKCAIFHGWIVVCLDSRSHTVSETWGMSTCKHLGLFCRKRLTMIVFMLKSPYSMFKSQIFMVESSQVGFNMVYIILNFSGKIWYFMTLYLHLGSWISPRSCAVRVLSQATLPSLERLKLTLETCREGPVMPSMVRILGWKKNGDKCGDFHVDFSPF